MSMTPDEMRDFTVRLFNPRTERDAQVEVGASNLSNPCDRCRAFEIAGTERSDRIMDGAWGGRVIGTSIHGRLDGNAKTAIETANEHGDDLAQLGWLYPGMQAERKMCLGELLPGRPIWSSTDLYIESRAVLVDYKNTDLRKLAFLVDALGIVRGTGPVFGRDHQMVVVLEPNVVKSGANKGSIVYRKAVEGVSERVYAAEIAHALYKIERYSRQLHLYGMGLENEGLPVEQLFLNFIARDSAMTVDNRQSERYMDEAAPRGVRSIAFGYSRDYAVGIWKDAQAMAKALEDGTKTPLDYASHPHCGVCAAEAKNEAKLAPVAAIDTPVSQQSAGDPWAALAAEKAGVAA
ncbi:hypothetical protein [Pseudolysinimonas sp.]|uniref:hypothetical protein n=1 Tax=Pseudolysinimonas sp. TaxID=2680009 RepID=UPI003F817C26